MKNQITTNLKEYILAITLTITTAMTNSSFAYDDKQRNKENNQTKELNIYAYRSFVSGGISEKITPIFEKQCNCKLNIHSIGNPQDIINRLIIEGDKTKADIVIGLDYSLIPQYQSKDLFQSYQLDKKTIEKLELPIDWTDKTYLPFDYGYFAFVYNSEKLQNPPTSFAELSNSKTSIIIQDPRTSTAGFGLLLWNKSINEENSANNWGKLKNNIITTTKGWSESYGLFLKDEADMVLSYTTSPFYHQLVDNDTKYKAATFSEGHYMQIETASITKHSQNVELANQFMDFIVSDEFQQLIPESNWMYPVINVNHISSIPNLFKNNKKPKAITLLNNSDIKSNYSNWINEWLESM